MSDITLSVEAAQAAVNEHGSIDQAAKALGYAHHPFRAFCREHGISKDRRHGAVDEQVVTIEKDPDPILQQENRKLRQQVKRLTEGEHDAERVIRRLEAAVNDAAPLFEPIKFKPVRSGDRTAQDLVLLFSDTHASEVVSLEETRGINEYGWDIMLQRMQKMSVGVLSHAQHYTFKIRRFHLHLLGDMLSGDIHDELAITNDRPTAEAVVQFAYDAATWIRDVAQKMVEAEILLPAPGAVHLAGVPGNHPRHTKKPAAKQAHNNADWLTYRLIEALLQGDPLFSFDFPRGSYNVQMICERYRSLLMHGDGIRTTMPGVPWGGVIRRITTLEQQFSKARQPLDYVELGHFHTRNALDGVQAEAYLNGSVKGPDEWSLKQFGHGQDAKQLLLSFHPEWGNTGAYPLNLMPKLPASEGW